jgi:hypothetical protein
MTYDHHKFEPFCASRLPTTGEPILTQRGHKGYWPAPSPDFDPEVYNRDMKVTNAQRMAMEIGSIFGFDVPGADPDFHLTTRTTKMTTTTMTKRQVRKRVWGTDPKSVLTNPYYRVLRDKFNRPANKALAAVRWFEAFRDGMEATHEQDKRSYPSGIARVVHGYWVFGS